MRGCILLITVFAARLVIAQVVPSVTGSFPVDEIQTPPPVNGTSYPIAVGADKRTNYLRVGVTYISAYIDNFDVGSAGTPLAETTQAVLSTMALETTTARQHLTVDYSPGFTLYFPSNSLSEMDNSATVDYDLRPTPHTRVKAFDQLQDSSSPFVAADAEVGGTVSGAPLSSTPGAVPPFAKTLMNSANVEVTEQTELNTMIGASGLWTTLHYPNPTQSTDLSDSSSRGGMGFYNKRITHEQYMGAIYQYLDMQTYQANGTSTTSTSTVLGYYTAYPKAGFSVSITGGPQYYHLSYPQLPSLAAWGPSVTASMGWQGNRTSLAASYSQSVTGGGGLSGAYHTRAAEMTATWRMARAWTVGVSGSYSANKTVDGSLPTEGEGGHGLNGTATLQHPLRDQLTVGLTYQHIHQSYDEIPAIASNPDSDRVSLMITWNFLHPLGR
jgi:hypothetical protein